MFSLPFVQIVILNFNGQKLLEKFLPSIIAVDYSNYEVVVVDNSSIGNDLYWLSENYPEVKVISHKKNYGYAKGYNEAMKQLSAKYCVFVNSDVKVEKNFLHPIIKQMEKDENIAACQPKVLNYNDKSIFDYAGGAGGFMDKLYYPFCKGRVFDILEKDKNQYDNRSEIFWASGACIIIKKEYFDNIGGFDEQYFMHHEEIDLCWRFQNYGYKIIAFPKSVIYHMGGATLSRLKPLKKYFNHRNNLLLIFKNLPLKTSFPILTLRICIETIYILMFYGIALKWRSLYYSLKGIGAFLFLTMTGKAKKSFSYKKNNKDKIPSLAGKVNTYLFIEYFIKKNDKFSQIIKH